MSDSNTADTHWLRDAIGELTGSWMSYAQAESLMYRCRLNLLVTSRLVTDRMVDEACSAYCREIVEQARADFAPGKTPQLYYRPAAIRAALVAAIQSENKP